MDMTANIYQKIAERTGGNIYIGVVGPVRSGKSTFVKRVMEQLVIPNIQNIYQRERAKDELPQSGSGRTIMTSEPKFVPEEAVEISPDGRARLSVRMIDSVGYMIPGALGAEEEGRPRMVTTPWHPEELPMAQAAEIGTKRIMEEHCSVGIVMTTDGTIHDIPREDFIQAEEKAIEDMKATGKPFLVLVNSAQPEAMAAKSIKERLENQFQVQCVCVNCLTLEEHEIRNIFKAILYEFPLIKIELFLPGWFEALPVSHKIKESLFETLRQSTSNISVLREAEHALKRVTEIDGVENVDINEIDLGEGSVSCRLEMEDSLFYNILSEHAGIKITNDYELMTMLSDLAETKREYDKVETALQQVRATGYGIVMPTPDEMHLEVPQIIRKGGNYGVKLKASAPSIHMLRADIQTEINPIVGDEKQSEDLLQYLLNEYENDTEKLWDSNIFGKSVYELVNDGLSNKLKRMPQDAQFKLQTTLSRIINEGSSGLLCIILS